MLTLKLINEETERVIRGLEKKHFPNAKEAIDEVLAVDKKRRDAQQELDKCLNEQKQLSGQIGRLMKEGKKDEAEQVKAQVADLKEKSKQMAMVVAAVESNLHEVPSYLEVDNKKLEAKYTFVPKFEDIPYASLMEPNMVIEFYSR